ncbi:MAG: ABC transporter ATP-binding protein [Candidatus Caldarchaeum sp.]
MNDKCLLKVEGLRVEIKTQAGVVKAVDGASLEIKENEIVGLVGESGCGKSMLALSIMRLLPEPYAKIVNGSILFDGVDLVKLKEDEMRKFRGRKISIIFQDPTSALNPIMKVGDQIVEAATAHGTVDRRQAWSMMLDVLKKVGIPRPEVVAQLYPFNLSGGMRQRVMIAMAMISNPKLLIADEPTTNLDVSIQAQILEILKEIKEKSKMSILLITHNLGLVAWLCDRVYVMYAGKILEAASTAELFDKPLHPYTELLLKAVPRTDSRTEQLATIEGEIPSLINPPPGCRFHPRCPYVMDVCKEVLPAEIHVGEKHFSRCLRHDLNYAHLWNSEDA